MIYSLSPGQKQTMLKRAVENIHSPNRLVVRIGQLLNKENLLKAFSGIVNEQDLLKSELFWDDQLRFPQLKRLDEIDDNSLPVTFDVVCAADQTVIELSGDEMYTDLTSLVVMLRSVLDRYHNVRQPAMNDALPFRSYAAWHNDLFQSPTPEIEEVLARYVNTKESEPLHFLEDASFSNSKELLHEELLLPASELQQAAALFEVEASTILFTVLEIMLAQYTGKEISIADFAFNRRDVPEIETTIGPVSQNIPLPVNVNSDVKWRDVLLQVQHTLRELYAVKESYPLQDDVFCRVGFESITVPPEILTAHHIDEITAIGAFGKQYDLKLTSTINADTVRVNFTVPAWKSTREALKAVVYRYQSIFTRCLDNADATVSWTCMIGSAERELIDKIGNNKVGSVQDVSILELLAKYSNPPGTRHIGLRVPGRDVSFDIIHELSGRLADYLIKVERVEPGDRIALVLGNSEWIPLAIVAVLKSGACFVPIDPSIPAARMKALLTDSGASLILVDSDHDLDHFLVPAIDLNWLALGNFDPMAAVRRTPDSLAYIIYTSGSTGTPKGVAIEDRSLVNYATWFIREFNIRNHDASVLLTSYSFDLSFSSIWGCLLSGASLTILAEDQIKDNSRLLEALITSRITFLKLTPSYLSLILDFPDKQKLNAAFQSIRLIVLGGEAIITKDLRKLWEINPSIQVVDEYGPTETTVGSIAKSFTVSSQLHGKRSIVGLPVSNTTVRICDRAGQLCPCGVVGEICIGGAGVARGYINDPNATSNKFGRLAGSEEIVYKTGDRGRLLANGEIEFLGRADSQLKVNGYRIEIEEINRAIRSLPGINDVRTVVDRSNDDNKRLASFITSDHVISESALARQLNAALPVYMIPAFFMQVRYFPLTANGKLDETELLSRLRTRSSEVIHRDPIGETETRLLQAFRKTLLTDHFGVESDFFLHGGDSIRAIRMVNAINSEFDLDLQVKDLYSTRTVEAMASFISKSSHIRRGRDMTELSARIKAQELEISQNPVYSKMLPAGWQRILPISDVEQGMIYHTLIQPGANIYVDETLIEIAYPEFDIKAFSSLVTSLVNKHDNLRASFHLTGFGRPVKIIHGPSNLDHVERVDLSAETTGTQHNEIQQALADYRRGIEDGFDHAFGTWRIIVFRLSQDKHAVGWIRHHSIIDGWSAASFLTELCNGYVELKQQGAFQPAPIKASYVDYLVEQEYYNSRPELKSFWQNFLSGFVKCQMPLNRSAGSPGKMTRERFILSDELASAVIDLSHTLAIPPKTIFLAAYIHLLSHSTNSTDITLGVVSTGRPEVEDGDKILGCFLHRLPFRMVIDTEVTCDDFIRSVHNKYNGLAPYNKVSLSTIVKAIQFKSQQIYDLAFDYMDFHVMNEMNPLLGGDASAMDSLVINEVTETLFDLSIHKTQSSFLISMNYPADIYLQAEIRDLMKYMVSTIEKYCLNTHSKCFDTSLYNALTNLNDSSAYADRSEPLIVKASPRRIEARNDIDRKLISAWSEILNIKEDKIGINHNFFDHGGHSLAAINLLSRITNDFPIAISIVAIFEFKDLAQMSDYISQQLQQVKAIDDSTLEPSRG